MTIPPPFAKFVRSHGSTVKCGRNCRHRMLGRSGMRDGTGDFAKPPDQLKVVTPMGKKSKRYRAVLEKQPKNPLPLEEAVEALKKYDSTKFDQTVEIHMRLGVDPNQADQIIRGSLVLPNGIGKTQRVVVFAKGDAAKAAEEAGADEVGQDDLAKKIKDGWTDFRCLYRRTGHDGLGRSAWTGARSTRIDAQPSCRHGHARCREGGHRIQGGQSRIPQ